MNSGTIVELAEHFDNKLVSIHTAFDLTQSKHDPACRKILGAVQSELEGLECILTLMRSEVDKWKQSKVDMQDLKPMYEDVIQNLKYAVEHVPARMPNRHPQNGCTEKTGKCEKKAAVPTVPENKVSTKSTKEAVCPTIQYLIVDEFESVPKYMKGRLTYNQVNGVIDELNKAFRSKYKIMRMKRSTMSDGNRKRYENYKLQETKDTQGVYFIVESDLKEFTTIKMDATARSMLTVLRHCCRLREIRGGKVTRFAFVESY